ncbi:MAG TPA: type II secretion system protein [Tepidisphaeraceae bacterium]|jgi:prepilin-type N-terminal cleavage/methylation domain-containing protein/prepilin-type processing-associated H-X9-DG protein|nr:type II secretion system protein [Tepidisphaeraceae bacterium]
MRRTQPKGFTLVELLVVIGIIALLISILMPALSKARIAAVQTQCMANHRQVMQAMQLYVNEFKGWAPVDGRNVYPEESTVASHQVHWYHRQYLGKYLGNRATYNQRDNTGGAYYCPAYVRDQNRPNLGIGYNMRRGNGISRTWTGWMERYKQKFTSIRQPANVIIFADVTNGNQWERFYNGEPGHTNTPGGTVNYRHGVNTVVAFADGHVETFAVANKSRTTNAAININEGLDRAHNLKQVSYRDTGK